MKDITTQDWREAQEDVARICKAAHRYARCQATTSLHVVPLQDRFQTQTERNLAEAALEHTRDFLFRRASDAKRHFQNNDKGR